MTYSETNGRKKGISLLNWLGTLLLCAIPGVNLITLIITAFAAKSRSKRNFAIAGIILIALCAAAVFAAFAIWGDEIVLWARSLNAEKAVGAVEAAAE